jgi:fructosamine-3-kinase
MFGLDHENYIGSLTQINSVKSDWLDFYINERLGYQLKMAVDHGKLGSGTVQDFEQFYVFLESFLPSEAPSLLHGDLWGGNLMIGSAGEPVIFDPAVYYGNREVDLAMTRLFGGFSSRFYETYNEEFPLLPGYEDRIDVYQLYPLLVHVNLFGGGYISQVKSILNQFI